MKFNAVGAAGAGVQLGVLQALLWFGVHYLAATALAVEAAVLHNYCWHVRWTWRERRGSLWRFHAANGMVSLASNLAWMRVLAGWLEAPPLAAGLAAIALSSVATFLLSETWVFRRGAHRGEGAEGASGGLHGVPQRFGRNAGHERPQHQAQPKRHIAR
jgi:putative flippase GtrA